MKNSERKESRNSNMPEQAPGEKYKYNETQAKESGHPEDFPDKPDNHTTPGERMMDPDRGE